MATGAFLRIACSKKMLNAGSIDSFYRHLLSQMGDIAKTALNVALAKPVYSNQFLQNYQIFGQIAKQHVVLLKRYLRQKALVSF